MNTIPQDVEDLVMSELGLTLTDLFKKDSVTLRNEITARLETYPSLLHERSSACEVVIQPNTEIKLVQKDSHISGVGYTNKVSFQLKCLELKTGYQYAKTSSFIIRLEKIIEALK